MEWFGHFGHGMVWTFWSWNGLEWFQYFGHGMVWTFAKEIVN